MRGLWDNEQTLTPALLRSGLALLGGLLLALAAANVAGGVFYLLEGRWLPAATQIAGGLAIPLGIWIAVKILSDFLTIQHRMNDRIQEMADQTAGVSDEAARTPQRPHAADAAPPDLSMADAV